MYSLQEFLELLDGYAPLSISHKLIERGEYDNSGIIVKCSNAVNKVLFSLDLTMNTVEKAKEFNCDTIVTHHPAIYSPIKSLSIDGVSAPVVQAIKSGMNVISMHLNLDMAEKGVDFWLCRALGAKEHKIIDVLEDGIGYGREFNVSKDLSKFVADIKEVLKTDKVIYYGNEKVGVCASFCGGGASSALAVVQNKKTLADTIITSDVSHHVLLELIEKNKNVIIIPHYVAEEYGFNKFYQSIKEQVKNKLEINYFADIRFR